MKNMTIARKLIAGFILVTIIAVFIGIFGISQMRKIEKADNYLYEKKTVPLVKLMNVADNFERAAANIAYCLYEKETGDFLEIADNAMQEAESNFSLYENASDDDNEDDLHLEMKVSWNEYKFYYDSLRWFALTEKYDEGIVWRRKDKGRTRRDFRAAVVKVVERDILEARLSAENNTTTANRASTAIFVAIAIGVLAALILGFLIARSIAGKLNVMVSVANSIAQGHLDNPIKTAGNDEVAKLALSLDKMQTALSEARKESNRQDWLKTGIMKLNDVMAGEPDIETLASNTISEITRYIDAQVGAFYVANDSADLSFSLIGSYAYTKRKNLSNVFKAGEGLVGQAALEKQQILIKNVPHDYIKVTSGLGERIASFICVTPFIYEKRVKGVIETGTLGEMTDMQMEYLRQAMPALAIAVESAQSRIRLTQSLEESRTLTEELRRQQEELKAANEELEEQTQRLVESERKMQSQQEELKVSNEELEERNEALQMQKKEIERTKKEVEAQAEELATASKYKSEFLANMSHELRTPLNSLLILSRMLADNKEGNLSKDQVESADIIYKSGDVLLSIINEILDLSRIEAGQMDLHIGYVFIKTLADNITNSFKHIIDEKGLSLIIRVDEKMPEFIESDEKRLEQVIRNLMSNAIKFTNTGNITVDFRCTPKTAALYRSGLFPENSIAVIVKDTGIGIAKGKQKIIFEAFQQAEGGTAREYGGTGLGLSISREIVNLLGGEIQVESQPGKGSTFTVYLPLKTGQTGKRQALAGIYNGVTERELNSKTLPKAQAEISVSDDREHLTGNKDLILIIEDDPDFARLLMKQCHEKDFQALIASDGETGLKLASEYLPVAVILDLRLPGIDGWAVLDLLKDNPDTRHIAVHIMSVEDYTLEAFRKGAIGYLTKPARKEELDTAFNTIEKISREKIKNMLVVEDDENSRAVIIKLIGNGDVHTKGVSSGKEAIYELKQNKYDCMILDIRLPDMSGFELLHFLEKNKINIPPVIVYTGKDLSRQEESELRKYSESIIIKGVKSEERLLDESALFLHRVVNNLPERKKKIILNLHDTDEMFKDKKVLLVDDDMRNVFALSRLLSEKGFILLKAENGIKALEILEKEKHIDLVLMDIMMPEMDGYETIKKIRAQEPYVNLPIIALTAKAMKKDFEQCLAAGANDYMAKPVNISRLLSMMRIWLYR